MVRDGDVLRSSVADVLFPKDKKPEDPDGAMSPMLIARFRKKWAVEGIAEFELAIPDEVLKKALGPAQG